MGKVNAINTFAGRFQDIPAHKPVAAFAVGLAVASHDTNNWMTVKAHSILRLHAGAGGNDPVCWYAGPGKPLLHPEKDYPVCKVTDRDFPNRHTIAAWARQLPWLM